MPEIVLIAAVAEKNRVIGQGMELPWHIPEDLKHFKRLTTGETLLMGRRTYESILHQFGGPLANRRMVVISSQGNLPEYPAAEVYRSPEEAMDALADQDRVFIAGGATIYEQFLPRADRMELTLVPGDFEGDTFFPPFEHLVGPVFEITWEDEREGLRFMTLRRREGAPT
jgi:dihydrofolate reductase